MEYHIYKLIDPITDEIRYIGQTQNIKNRLSCHISTSKQKINGKFKFNDYKHRWIRTLLSKNLKPTIKIIETCYSIEEADRKEIAAIEYHTRNNHKLTNNQSGGNTSGCRIINADSIKRMKIAARLTNKKRYKPVLQYDLDGNFIKEYESLKSTGYSASTIGTCCKLKLKSYMNYQWRYKLSDNYPLKIEPYKTDYKVSPVLQYDLDGNFIKEYEKIIDIPFLNISYACSGERQTVNGYQWRYKLSDNYPLKIEPYKPVIYKDDYKPVLQYDLDGNFIKEYESLGESIRIANITSIGLCCANKIKSAGNYQWRYKLSDNYPLKINAYIKQKIATTKIYQYDLDGNFIKEYESIVLASKISGTEKTNISRSARSKNRTAGGYKWKFQKDGLSIRMV